MTSRKTRLLVAIALISLVLTISAVSAAVYARQSDLSQHFSYQSPLYDVSLPADWAAASNGATVWVGNSESVVESMKVEDYNPEAGDFGMIMFLLPAQYLGLSNLTVGTDYTFEELAQVAAAATTPKIEATSQTTITAGEAQVVTLDDGRKAGALPLSNENSEGFLLTYPEDDHTFVVILGAAPKGELDQYLLTAHSIISSLEVTFTTDGS